MRIPTAVLRVVPGLALGLSGAAARAAPTAPSAASGPVAPADIEARRAAALRLHEERRPAEAAVLLERLAEETGRSDLLFDAGQARFAAGHRAHALRHWERYARAPGRGGDDLALVTARLADARALLTPIAIEVLVPDDLSEVTATLRRLYDPPDQQRPAIAVVMRAVGGVARAEVALDPGVWSLSLGSAAKREVHVDRAPTSITISLRAAAPSPAPPPPDRPRGLIAGLGALAAVTAVPGAVLTGIGARRFGARAGACAMDTSDPRCVEAALLADARWTGAGAGLLGAGVGAAITAAAPTSRRASLGELGAGGGLLALGAAWLAAENVTYARVPGEDALYLASLRPWLARRSAAAALLGAGVGLAVGASARLLVRRPGAPKPTLGLASVGLSVDF